VIVLGIGKDAKDDEIVPIVLQQMGCRSSTLASGHWSNCVATLLPTPLVVFPMFMKTTHSKQNQVVDALGNIHCIWHSLIF